MKQKAGLTTDRIETDPMLMCPLAVTEEMEKCITEVRQPHRERVLY
jgi:hypothetical protein